MSDTSDEGRKPRRQGGVFRFSPTGLERDDALAVLGVATIAITSDNAGALLKLVGTIEPDPDTAGEASVYGVIAVGLNLLDEWHSDRAQVVEGASARLPNVDGRLVRAARDSLALAQKGEAGGSIFPLVGRHGGAILLMAILFAVAAALESWAVHDQLSIMDVVNKGILGL